MPVALTTSSRLHFGLLRFEQPDGLSFGGLGMMIAEPRWQLQLDAADQWTADGPASERALEFARHILERIDAASKPAALRVHVREAIPTHRGFGGGTQLGLAVAAGVRQLLGLPAVTAAELAKLAGRGRRSAVGAHGFVHGGLIWEIGRQPGEALGQLAARIAVPASWRIVLIDAGDQSGLSGAPERDAFSRLPAVSDRVANHLMRIAEHTILPAAARGDVGEFGKGVYEYGRRAGECFASIQGGAYATPEIARCVDAIRALGIPGAGQSSWGPTVFAITEDQQQAQWLCEALAQNAAGRPPATRITSPANRGAVIETT